MNNFIGKNIREIVELGPYLMSGLLLLLLASYFLMVRKNRYFLPKSFLQLFASIPLLLLLSFSSLVLAKITQMRPQVMPILAQMDDLIGKPAPTLNYTNIANGQTKNLEEFQGKLVLVNYWATWCRPCLAEIPALEAIEAAYQDQGVKIIMISDEPIERLQKFADKRSLNVEMGTLSSFDWAALGNDRPATFLVDNKGEIVEYFTGARDYAFFERAINKYLGK